MFIPGESHTPLSDIQDQDNTGNPALLAGESQALDTSEYDGLDDILLCKEILDPSDLLNGPGLDSIGDDFTYSENRIPGNDNVTTGTFVLDALELDTPDFDLWVSISLPLLHFFFEVFQFTDMLCGLSICLQNLNFCSQDSIFDWLDRL